VNYLRRLGGEADRTCGSMALARLLPLWLCPNRCCPAASAALIDNYVGTLRQRVEDTGVLLVVNDFDGPTVCAARARWRISRGHCDLPYAVKR
jgi:hypothetical protein